MHDLGLSGLGLGKAADGSVTTTDDNEQGEV
jgi:hypothetical protein